MPITPTYPGVYVLELPSRTHTLTGASTSTTAFVDYFPQGPVGEAVQINSFAEFQRTFGGLDANSEASYGIMQYFLNGGGSAYVVRVAPNDAALAKAVVRTTPPTGLESGGEATTDASRLTIYAINEGAWGNRLQAILYQAPLPVPDPVAKAAADEKIAADAAAAKAVTAAKDAATAAADADKKAAANTATDADKKAATDAAAAKAEADASVVKTAAAAKAAADKKTAADAKAAADAVAERPFNLQVRLVDPLNNVVASESYVGLTWDPQSPMYAVDAVKAASTLVRLKDDNGQRPFYHPARAVTPELTWIRLSGGVNGSWKTDPSNEYADGLLQMLQPDGSPLTKIAPNIFNLLCLPGAAKLAGQANAVWTAAAALCLSHRALLLIDPPSVLGAPTPKSAIDWFNGLTLSQPQKACAVTYWPPIMIPDPLKGYRNREVGPSGTMAGVYALTDTQRGVWKAPAGTSAGLSGAVPAYPLKDSENGDMNPLGLNAIRQFPVYGVVSWGARTVAGADDIGDQYKYVPVRRLAQYIENSVFAGLKWAVFEPNGENLWAAIRQQVGDFMAGLFRQGAFAGGSPSSAFFVQCDSKTTTPSDTAQGIVNVIVGFAPLSPAEFVIVQIEQIAGQSA